MLIIPLTRKLSLATFPFMTAVLLLVNVWVYFAWQGADEVVAKNFVEAYAKSGLAEQELPVYIDWLVAKGTLGRQDTQAPTAEELANPTVRAQVAVALQRDLKFQRELPAHMQKKLGSAPFAQWQNQRAAVDEIWQKNFTARYLFVPALARNETLLTHMFMHGGFGHLFGNMVMLILIGLLVEPAIGAWRTAALYLLGGLGAAAPYYVFLSDSWTGLLGASGAIAALMGACAVLYGLRRVRFFYHVLFYFDFIVLPAIVVLPVWLANELWQWMHLRNVSNVAYLAHIGGLIAGALCALMFRSKAALVLAQDKTPTIEQEEDHSKLHARAYASLKKMQWDAAAREFEQLQRLQPDNLDYAQQLYTCARSAPASERYHHAATQVMRLSGKTGATDLLAKTLTEYRKNAMPLPRLSGEDLARYAKQLAKTDHRALAITLADALLKLRPAQRGNTNVADLVLTMAVACHRGGSGEGQRYLQVLETQYPGSEQLKLAKQFVAA